MATRPIKWRILAIFAGSSLDSAVLKDENSENSCLDEVTDLVGSDAELLILRDKPFEEVAEQLISWKPNLVYFTSGAAQLGSSLAPGDQPWPQKQPEGDSTVGPGRITELLKSTQIDSVYFDCIATQVQAEAIREQGIANVLFYPKPSKALHACQFAHAFFATLRSMTAPVPEAFAIASHSAQAYCTTAPGGAHVAPILPTLLSDAPPKLPNMEGIPLPALEGVDLTPGVVGVVSGWDSVRLLAPHAELKLLTCSQPTLIDAHRLSFLGEALRAVLVLEMRTLTIASTASCERVPAHLPPGCTALRATLQSCSGAQAMVVLGGPPNVLESAPLVEHALRNTLVADALSLQFRLPPANVPPPTVKSSPTIANGAPTVDALVDASYRGLVSLGIAAIGGTPGAAFSTADTSRYAALAASDAAAAAAAPAARTATAVGNGPQPAPPGGATAATGGPAGDGLPNEGSADLGDQAGPSNAADGEENAEGLAGRRKRRRRGPPSDTPAWKSSRPALPMCKEAEFLADLGAFLQERCDRKYDPESFPDAILNGRKLDVFNLYKEVVRRGGYGMGNGINWKGQIFPAMRNFTSSNRMTGVGNALKRHYVGYLHEYEQAHPEDITGDVCAICGGSEDIATDWISCDMCDTWVHFSCDTRPYLGAFKDYAKGQGQSYTCSRCHDIKKRKQAAS